MSGGQNPFGLGLVILLCLHVSFRNAYTTDVFAYAVMYFILGRTCFLSVAIATGVLLVTGVFTRAVEAFFFDTLLLYNALEAYCFFLPAMGTKQA